MSVFTNSSSSSPAEITAYVSAVLGLIEGHDPLAVLRDTPPSLARTLEQLGPQAVRIPEAPGKWSVNEVLQHLADSELVFGWRIRLVLAHERPAITGYDQDRWADRLRYADADPAEAIERFTVLRRANLALLERASAEDLRRVGVHAERGEETLAHIIRLYAGHDLLHLRQIERIRGAIASA
jgi:DinB superfamily